MADLTRLVNALESYSRELDRHNAQVADAYHQLEQALARLSGVYEGTAAREFKAHWARTKSGLHEYTDGAQAIRSLLDQRLSALKEADRPAPL
jgi:uncharacterized protein YukE